MSTEVASTSEIQEGERKCFKIGEEEITVINLDGEYYAVRNLCPHQGGPVGLGPITEIEGERAIQCPFHEWSFSLETGHTLGNYQSALRTYNVFTEDGTIYVDI